MRERVFPGRLTARANYLFRPPTVFEPGTNQPRARNASLVPSRTQPR
jgi:hypothetical protein